MGYFWVGLAHCDKGFRFDVAGSRLGDSFSLFFWLCFQLWAPSRCSRFEDETKWAGE